VPTYYVNAHDCLNGRTDRSMMSNKRGAVWTAERLFNRNEFLWVDVICEDKRGRISYIHHIEREPTEAERAAIIARYYPHRPAGV
jgi:hypothetical protein